ncbi:hypothetical protein [Rhodovulum kholense]|uniref:Uncharacterized protein n=1 Tax=Rhodovulum kholense TaxID=453584 RepID=A0A8E2VN82_9RHOB|nr:hypothetical protein [Rhodovulum kholense]PTW52231.1 hypothetical protein C8N38_101536 [Rhodovulum kholense]
MSSRSARLRPSRFWRMCREKLSPPQLEKPLNITRRQPRQSGDIAQGQLLHRQPRVDSGRDPPEMRDLNGRHPAVVQIRLAQDGVAKHVQQGALAGGKVLLGQRVELRAENRQHRPRHIGGNRPAQHQRPRQPLSAEPGRDAVGRRSGQPEFGQPRAPERRAPRLGQRRQIQMIGGQSAVHPATSLAQQRPPGAGNPGGGGPVSVHMP